MQKFEDLYKLYETTHDFSGTFSNNKIESDITRFLLIRSLDREDLKAIYNSKNNESFNNAKGLEQYTKVYYCDAISNKDILNYILNKRKELYELRKQETDGLVDLILNFGEVNCGVSNDKIDDIVKTLVRDKSIKTRDELEYRIDNLVLPRLKHYILWSFYNQISNDVIELYFLKNPKIIPTLRKIHDIDFFVFTQDDCVIPVDLKITHISDSFFDIYSKGLTFSCDNDMFTVGTGKSEIETIKEFYKEHKKSLNLPGYGGKSKKELLENLNSTNDIGCTRFVKEMFEYREKLVGKMNGELNQLEWWNYKFQGERLFSNNNRIFIFLAYKNSFEDGRPLKGKLSAISDAIEHLLLSLNTSEDFDKVRYVYEKEADLNGNYTCMCKSTLITSLK